MVLLFLQRLQLVILLLSSAPWASSSFVVPPVAHPSSSTRERATFATPRQRVGRKSNRSEEEEVCGGNGVEDAIARRRFLITSSSIAFAGMLAGVGTLPLPANAASDASKPSSMGSSSTASQQPRQGPKNRRLGGLVSKIRGVGDVMDELQRDLMQERWDLVGNYPPQLRSYVPVFTTYTDSAFPSDAPTDTGLRVALRYEVGRFFASLERFKQAAARKALDEAYVAYSDMSLHFDRYLRVGGLYTYYDDTVSLEPYFAGISDSDLVYANPKVDPPLVRDLIILIKGPDKGRTGIVIGVYKDGNDKVAIKLDRYKEMREIRLVPKSWVAKRVGEQDPDDVFLIPRKQKTR